MWQCTRWVHVRVPTFPPKRVWPQVKDALDALVLPAHAEISHDVHGQERLESQPLPGSALHDDREGAIQEDLRARARLTDRTNRGERMRCPLRVGENPRQATRRVAPPRQARHQLRNSDVVAQAGVGCLPPAG